MIVLINTGRKFYGICLTGLGFQQLVYADFLPVILPAWPSRIPGVALWAYLTGALLMGVGAAIFFEKKGRIVALISGGAFLLLFILGHVPYQIIANPYSNYLGTWTNAFKMLALSGGAFVVAGSCTDADKLSGQSPITRFLEKLIPFGRVLFSITMIVFGIDHFLYVEMVSALVPAWIPWHIFWAYFSAVALIGAGVAIIFKIKLKLIGTLLGIMIFLWFILLHIPRSIADPVTNKGNEVTSTFQALGFSGIALMLAHTMKSKRKK